MAGEPLAVLQHRLADGREDQGAADPGHAKSGQHPFVGQEESEYNKLHPLCLEAEFSRCRLLVFLCLSFADEAVATLPFTAFHRFSPPFIGAPLLRSQYAKEIARGFAARNYNTSGPSMRQMAEQLMEEGDPSGLASHCRCCRSAAPPSSFSRCFNRTGERMSAF